MIVDMALVTLVMLQYTGPLRSCVYGIIHKCIEECLYSRR